MKSSKNFLCRCSSWVRRTTRPDATSSKCLQTHIAAAGIACDAPIISFVAVRRTQNLVSDTYKNEIQRSEDPLISHHTSHLGLALSAHTSELSP